MNKLFMAFMDTTFGTWLRQRRRAAGLSQGALAERVSARGVSLTAGYVSNLERNAYRTLEGHPSRPREQIVDAIAKVLDADINEARLAAGYAPVSVQMQNGFKIHLPDGLEMYIPYSVEISTQEEADRLQQDIELVYQMTKERLRRERERLTGNGE